MNCYLGATLSITQVSGVKLDVGLLQRFLERVPQPLWVECVFTSRLDLHVDAARLVREVCYCAPCCIELLAIGAEADLNDVCAWRRRRWRRWRWCDASLGHDHCSWLVEQTPSTGHLWDQDKYPPDALFRGPPPAGRASPRTRPGPVAQGQVEPLPVVDLLDEGAARPTRCAPAPTARASRGCRGSGRRLPQCRSRGSRRPGRLPCADCCQPATSFCRRQ